MRASLKAFLNSAFKKLDQLSLEVIDAIMSLIPEMAPPKVTIGSFC